MTHHTELKRLSNEHEGLDLAKRVGVHYHWVSLPLPEEVMAIRNGVVKYRGTHCKCKFTDTVLGYNAALDIIVLGRRILIKGEWRWDCECEISQWALLPLSPRELKEDTRIEHRIAIQELL